MGRDNELDSVSVTSHTKRKRNFNQCQNQNITTNHQKTELLRLHDLTSCTSDKNKLCAIETKISKSLEQMDEVNSKPYIDQKQIYEIKHIYGKHGKYTQCILTTYTEYDDGETADGMTDLSSLPPLPQ